MLGWSPMSASGSQVLVTFKEGEVGHLLMTVSLPDHVLPTGLNEVHGEVFSVPWRVCPQFVELAEV